MANLGSRVQHVSRADPNEFRDPANLVPVGNIYVGIPVDVTSVGGTEYGRCNLIRPKLIVGPLSLARVVSEKSHRCIVLVEDRDASFQFRDDGKVAMKAHLTGAAEMLGHGSREFPVKIEVAKAPIFAVAHEEKGLIVACVDCQAVTAVE